MDYFENTTRITEDGYAAILQMQKKQHCIICRAIGILLAIPFLERLIYRGILLGIGDTADFHLGFLDFFFCCCWLLPFGYGICRKNRYKTAFAAQGGNWIYRRSTNTLFYRNVSA